MLEAYYLAVEVLSLHYAVEPTKLRPIKSMIIGL